MYLGKNTSQSEHKFVIIGKAIRLLLIFLCISFFPSSLTAEKNPSSSFLSEEEEQFWDFFYTASTRKGNRILQLKIGDGNLKEHEEVRYRSLSYYAKFFYNVQIKKTYERLSEFKTEFEDELNKDEISQALILICDAKVLTKKNETDQAIAIVEKAGLIFEKNNYYPATAFNKNILANLYKKKKDWPNFISNLENAFTQFHSKSDTILAIQTCLQLNVKDFQGKHLYEMRSFYEKAIQLSKQHNIPANLASTIYSKYGELNRYLGEFKIADQYYLRAIDIMEAEEEVNLFKINFLKYNQAHNLKSMRDLENCISLYEDVLEFQNSMPQKYRPIHLAEVKFKIGSAYELANNYEQAIKYLSEAYETRKEIVGQNHFITANVFQRIGTVLRKKGDFLSAEPILKESLTIRHLDSARMFNISSANFELAQLYGAQNDIELAKKHLQQSLADIGYYPNEPLAADRNSFLFLLTILNYQQGLYLQEYTLEGKKNALEEGRDQLLKSLYLFDKMILQVNDPLSKLNLYKEFYSFFEQGLDLYHKLWLEDPRESYFKEAVLIADKSRDIILQESILKKKLADHPEAKKLLEEEQLLAANLADLELELFELEQKEIKRPLRVKEINNEILELKRSLGFVKESMQTKFESGLFTGIHLGQYDEIFNDIDPNTAFLQFVHGDQKLFSFQIAKGIQRFEKTDIDDAFYAQCEKLYKELSKNFTDPSSDWDNISKSLYKKLFGNFEEDLSKYENIQIIADGALSKIPFEILINPTGGKYLIEEHAISYANSLASFNSLKNKKAKGKKNFAGFAPEYSPFEVAESDTTQSESFALLVRSGNYHLPGAQDEVEKISALVKGDRYLKKESAKEDFLQFADRYKILHLSMHALLEEENPEYSRLLFTQKQKGDRATDYSLFVNELSTMNLNAEMAVLSACNTGSGEYKKGEGKISLSRAFNYAGVPSTVHSLWKVPDEATSIIMLEFYRQLKEGENKDAALRNAKLHYLEQNVVQERAHPFYWAGFVIAGDPKPIHFNSPLPKWIYVLGFLTLVVLSFFLWKKNS